ncbi:hypothetical protein M0M57_11730 [Flavobacterium azooxidireducens]|uniref:Insecticide toxin TcdB middle/N-terminal domain-containing protein n=1 Tax=Flavobacterium azooxidireducens TaxID=1871076 RepID=A0ABY4KBX3_9FLAO|nr:JAB-like toxin 1 domain-containing protein [Flavobacterium azooxidireducens]UPQ78288.1 hypothetical protein M0M57_11730 [Flavobacterium azooxidireducens]
MFVFPVPKYTIYNFRNSHSPITASGTHSFNNTCTSHLFESFTISGQTFSQPNLYLRCGNTLGENFTNCLTPTDYLNFSNTDRYYGNSNSQFESESQNFSSLIFNSTSEMITPPVFITSSFPANKLSFDYHGTYEGSDAYYSGSTIFTNYSSTSNDLVGTLVLKRLSSPFNIINTFNITLQISQTNYIPFNASINGNPLFDSNYAYFTTGVNGSNGFNVFRNHILALYPGADVFYVNSSNSISVRIFNTTDDLSEITISTADNQVTNSYDIVETNCDPFLRISPNNNFVKKGWENYKPSQDEVKFNEMKMVSEGAELKLPFSHLTLFYELLLNEETSKELGSQNFLWSKEEGLEKWLDSNGLEVKDPTVLAILKQQLPSYMPLAYFELKEKQQEKEYEQRLLAQKEAKEWLKDNNFYQKLEDRNQQLIQSKKQDNLLKSKSNDVNSNKKEGLFSKGNLDIFTGGNPPSTTNSYVFENSFPFGDPECPSFLNTEFLVTGEEPIPSFNSYFSPLGSSSTKGEGIGGYLGLIGVGCNWFAKNITFGFGIGVSGNRTKSQVSLIDINGDGLSDIVTQSGDVIRYRPHIVNRTINEEGEEVISHSFGLNRMITGIDRFYYSTGKSEQYNFSFNSIFSIGWEKSTSKSTTNIYFTDANGDGLIDIVKNGLVYFNHVESDGALTFIPDSKASENLVIVAAPVSVSEPEEDPEFTLPSYDVVKVWEAPADGVITINNDITLLDSSQSAVVTVEKKNATVETQQCYSVDFVAPNVTSTLYKYSTDGSFYSINNATHTNSQIYGSCQRTSTRINSFKFNSSSPVYTPSSPNLLFVSHGNSQQGTLNQCSGIIPQYCSPFDFNNTDCADISIRSANSVDTITNWFSSILDGSSVPYSYLSFENLSHNMLEINNFGTSHLYSFMNRYGYKFSFFSTSNQFNGVFKNGYNLSGSIWTSNQFPDQELTHTNLGNLTVGVNAYVHINGNLLGTFNLVDNFSAFQSAFQSVYGNAYQLTAPTSANNYTIGIQMYGSTAFSSVTVTPVATPNQATNYPFNVTENCGVQRSGVITNDLISANYTNLEPTKEAKEFAMNKWFAEGKELVLPYDEVHPTLFFDFTENDKDNTVSGIYKMVIKSFQAFWFDQNENPIQGDLSSKLSLLSGIDTKKYAEDFQNKHIQLAEQDRVKRQQNAQKWLADYIKTYQQLTPSRVDSTFARSENQSECQDTNELCLLYGTELNSTNVNVVNSLTTNCNGQPLAVEKGDRIYFRLHTKTDSNPPVNWNPSINYVDSQYQNVVDQNGYDVYNTSYSDGFVLTQSRAFTVPGKQGNASITWQPFTINQPSNDVVYKIIKQAVNIETQQLVAGSESVIYSQVCASNATTGVNPTGLSAINFTDNGTITQFLFVAESTSNVKWKEYQWNPVVTTTLSENVIGENGTEGVITSTEINYPVVDYTVYKQYVCGPLYSTFDVSQVNGGANLTIRPMYGGVFSSGDYGKLHFVVKNNGKLVGSRSLVVNNGSLQSLSGLPAYDNPIPMDNLIGSQIEIGFYAENDQANKGGELLVAKLQAAVNSTVRISYSGSNYSVPNSNVNLHHRYNRFGPMYRQWGQFFYNPAQVTGATTSTYGNLIKEDVLFYAYDLDELQNLIDGAEGLDLVITEEDSGAAALADLTNLQSQYEAFAQDGSAFLPPTALRETGAEPKWIAFHGENYAAEQSFKAAPMTQSLSSEYDVEPYNYQGLLNTGAVGINKVFRSKGQNVSAGASYAGIGISVSKSIQGSGKLVTDYTDLNGDRYPDVVTTDKIQFTTRTGGLNAETNRQNEEQIVTLNSNSNFGVGVSGGFGGKNDDQGAKGSTPQKMTTTTNSTKSSTSIGLSGNFSTGKSFTDSFWSDVNGDGLSDLITKNGNSIQVFLNKGGKLESSSAVWTNLGNVFESRATNIGGGVGLSLWNSSIQGGVSLTSSWNNTKNTFLDINGDGLVDFVDTDDELNVSINRGNRFIAQQQWSDYNLNRESVSVTAGGNLAFTIAPNFGIPFTSLCIKFFAITVSGNLSTSTNKTEKTITDFDGDGYPDLIEKISGTQVRVYHSKIRRTDKLKSVTNSLGGKFTLDYQVHKINYDNPHPKWVLSSVEINDKYNLVNDGQDIYKKNYEYENPRYDRRERDFYGFETVKSIDYTVDEEGVQDAIYRTSVTKYHNRSYFLKGLVKETALYKGNMASNLLYSRSENDYEIRRLLDDNLVVDTSTGGIMSQTFDVGGTEGRRSAIVFLTKQKSYVYELGSSPLVNESVLKYDEKGRVIEYDYMGNPSDTQDNYKTTIKYHAISSLTEKNIIKIPAEVVVSINGNTKRKRATDNIDNNTGVIQTIKSFYANSSGTFAQVDLKYNEYGNIVHIYYPENETAQRMEYAYEYDTDHYKYIVKTSDAFGYFSETSYNPRFDVPEMVKDLADNKTLYKYDSYGRLTVVVGPKEIENQNPYTIAFSYFPKYTDLQSSPYQGLVTEEEFVPVALTNHFDDQHSNNTIDTYTFVDGMSRVMQVKKDITINKNEDPTLSPNYGEMMSVSGAVSYDEFGRAIRQFHPSLEGKSNSINIKYNQDAITHFKQSIYDELDRVVESIDEEGNQSFAEYSIEGTFHKTRSVTQQTSSVDIISESFKDVNGRVIKTNNVGPNGDIFTHFGYNAIGELLNYTDDMGMVTSYKYDLLGRKVYMNHPDRGDMFYRYDDASNLTYLQTSNLATDNEFVHYSYNYNRLESIEFPEVVPGVDNLSNVNYTFGALGSGNETGRLICQEDASGRQEFKYGNMGEVILNKRTIIAPTPNLPNRTYVTQFAYDSWNRLQGMVYPDGEKVSYFYDLGGNLNGVEGDHRYVERVDYDHYEQRRYIKYGNGTETIYDYSPELRRLEQLQVLTSNNEHLLKNAYAYDFVGNVTKIENSATYHSVNRMGGKYEHNYGYDNLNRLIGAKGGFSGHASQLEIGNDFKSEYKLKMDYNSTHGIVNKSQDHSKNDIAYLPNTYANDYSYFEGTHKLKQIDNPTNGDFESFNYDQNGNIISRVNQDNNQKYYFWDESDRLRVAVERVRLHHYIYDAGGQRVLKASSSMEDLYENGQLVSSTVQMGNYTSYPSAFLVVDPDGVYSKHYYAGAQRIAARVGEESADRLFPEDSERFCSRRSSGRTEDEHKKLQQDDLQYYLEKGEIKTKLSFKEYKPQLDKEEDETTSYSDNGESYAARPKDQIYYYHPDHLGTATFLTDGNGLPYEFFLNLPFGETMAEQHSQTSDYENRWKFTGHELDRETGLYYAGARYYDPKISIWLSVDPLAEKYPQKNPYHYVSCNPINRIDPDGRDDYEIDKQGNLINRIENKRVDSFHIVEQDSDGKWNRVEGKSVSFAYGTVESVRSESATYSKRENGSRVEASTNVDIYKIRGDKNGEKMFEFVADNTSVEWSHIKTGVEGNRGLNFITTGHIEYSEPGVKTVINGQLQFNYTIREINHNHPKNTPYPSGIPGFTGDVGDVPFAKTVSDWYESKYPERNSIPSFNIYIPKSKSYVPFSRNSKKSDYGF